MATNQTQMIHGLVSSAVEAAGFDLEEVTVIPAGRRRLIRVVIDSDTGVDLDAAADVSHAIEKTLDEHDPFGESPYTLEVTSPGIGRPLTEPRHFRRAAGRLLAVSLTDGTSLSARVRRAGDAAVEVLTGADGTIPVSLPYEQIDKAKVEVEWGPPSAAVLALLAGQEDL